MMRNQMMATSQGEDREPEDKKYLPTGCQSIYEQRSSEMNDNCDFKATGRITTHV